MDFRSLTYFVTVARELNFTRASEKLNMSQPPLSNQIRLLEEELGVRLFIRGKRHLTLTEEGKLFFHRAVQILEMADKTKRDIAYMKEGLSGKLTLGLVEGRPPFMIARWIAGFHEEFPLVRFEMWNGSTDDVLDRLNRGLVDLALIATPYDEEHLEGIMIEKSPWVAIMSREHPLAQTPGNTLSLSELGDVPLIIPRRDSRIIEMRQWFREAGIEPHILCELSSYVDAVALAEQNAGVAIFAQGTYTPNNLVEIRMLTDPVRIVENVLVWPKDRPLNSLSREFLNYVNDFLEEDQMHSERFQVREDVFELPPDQEVGSEES